MTDLDLSLSPSSCLHPQGKQLQGHQEEERKGTEVGFSRKAKLERVLIFVYITEPLQSYC